MLLITQRYQLGHLCFIRANSEEPVEEKGGGGKGGLQDLGEGSHGYQGERGGDWSSLTEHKRGTVES